jgi:hypothetical protein
MVSDHVILSFLGVYDRSRRVWDNGLRVFPIEFRPNGATDSRVQHLAFLPIIG